MAQVGKTVRIFVSSTFSDLKEERNALQRFVFPRLRELCLQHGCRFQAIDLRWGVRDEAALDQQTLKICLEEIKRCQRVTPRPNFIVLLGDRYGWRPLPAEIRASEFEQMWLRVTDNRHRELLSRWYKRDDNAAPSVYCLQPRELDVSQVRTEQEKRVVREAEAAKWDLIERRIRGILTAALDGIVMTDEQKTRYLTSATEQEIAAGAMNVLDAHEHVFCFFRRLKNLPQGVGAKDFIDLEADGSLDRQAHAQLEVLKERLARQLPDNVHRYESEWISDRIAQGQRSTRPEKLITTDHIGTLPESLGDCIQLIDGDDAQSNLCVDVWKRLARVILDEFNKIKSVEPLRAEIENHDAFGKEREKHFTGRNEILQAISDYINRDDRQVLVVHGVSGSGKTALIAKARELSAKDSPGAVVVARFIGATLDSSNGHALLEMLCEEISDRYEAGEAVSADYGELVSEFSKKLALATAERPLIIFLDALDQLSATDNARSFAWLPAYLPEHVRLIVSTLSGECQFALEHKQPKVNLIELGPMKKEEGEHLLNLWLGEAKRKLRADQQQEVLTKFVVSGLPLYLKLAFEEARRWRSYSSAISLKTDSDGMIHDMFERLSTDHGPMLVERSLGYLAASKNGLSEDEVLDVLERDEEFFADFKEHAHHDLPQNEGSEQKLPVAVWVRLYSDLEPYLTQQSVDGISLLTFYHRQVGEIAAKKSLTPDASRKRHLALADYFEGRGYDYRRTLGELAYHLYHYALASSDCRRLYTLIDDETFRRLQFRCFGRPEPIISDLGLALDLAARFSDPVQLVHFAMLRINIAQVLYRTFLYRFVETAKQSPSLARGLAHLVPDLSLRRMALMLMAWVFSRQAETRKYVLELVEDALRVRVPATVSQSPVLLEMCKDLYGAGVQEAIGLLKFIPHSPVRQTYKNAWLNAAEPLRSLAGELVRTESGTYHSTEAELAEFNKIQNFVAETSRQLGDRVYGMALEKRLYKRFGGHLPDAYFLLAASEIHTPNLKYASVFINRGVYLPHTFGHPLLRALSALIEALTAVAERDLAGENIARIQTGARVLKRMATREPELGRLRDVLGDLALAFDRLPSSWNIPIIPELSGLSYSPDASEMDDSLALLSNARQLLARGDLGSLPGILRRLVGNVEQGGRTADTEAVLVSAYALAQVSEESVLSADSLSRLKARGFDHEALFSREGTNLQAQIVLERLAHSDPRCIASVALCLRLAGLKHRLFHFARIAAASDAEPQALDAILAQVIYMSEIAPAELRRMSDELVFASELPRVVRGLGMYYYPGVFLCVAWSGIVLTATAVAAPLASPGLAVGTAALIAAFFVGGLLDLGIWRLMGVWDKPEVSSRVLVTHAGSAVSSWAAFLLLRSWLFPAGSRMGTGALVAFLLPAILSFIAFRTGLLFSPLRPALIRAGMVVSILAAVILGVISIVFTRDILSPLVLRDVFFVGGFLIAACANLWPKRCAVVRYYGSRLNSNHSELKLESEE